MKQDRLLELRILTGSHAGARVPLPEGELQVGGSDSSDVLLSDEGLAQLQLRLAVQDDGSLAIRGPDDEEGAPPTLLQPGEGTRLGPVVLAFEHADAPWREDIPLIGAAPAATEAGQDAAATTDNATDPAPPGPLQASGPRRRAARWRNLRKALPVLGLLGIVAIAGNVWWSRATPPAPAGAQALPVSVALAAGPSADQIRQSYAGLRLSGKVRVETTPTPLVRASFLPDEEAEALATALARLNPRPRLMLVSEQDVQQAVDDALEQQATPKPLTAAHLGQGRFRIEGRVASAQVREQVLAALTAAVPDASGFEARLVTDAEAGEALLADLRGQGLPQVEGRWHEGRMDLRIKLPPEDRALWERALAAAVQRHDLPLRATVEPAPTRLVAAPPLPPPPVVRSVISGALPYIVLDDGRKLMVDGRTEQWRLVTIAARTLVFETDQGRRLTLDR